MMSCTVVCDSEDCWSLAGFNYNIMMPLQTFPPKVIILQEKVYAILQECDIHIIIEVGGMLHSREPIVYMT